MNPHSFGIVQQKADLSSYKHITGLLTPDQQNTLASALGIILRHRSVLIYEMTGSGKTFVASALAAILQSRENSECIVVAPAHLLHPWKTVAAQFKLQATYYSYQAASLHSIPLPNKDDAVWLIDEAHTLKNRNTKRFAELQRLTSRHRVCLITATPVSMGWRDLSALMTICGLPQLDLNDDTAWLQAFARAIIPQTHVPALTTDTFISAQTLHLNYTTPSDAFDRFMSELNAIQWMTLNQNQTLDEIRLLPVLLMHRFLSHPASCLMTLRRLEKYYAAACHGSSQKILSRKEFHQLMGIEGTQLLLPFAQSPYGTDVSNIQKTKLATELNHIKSAIRSLNSILDANDDKLCQLQALIESNLQNKYVIFTQYADTADYIAGHLKCAVPIALLTPDKAEYNRHRIDPDILMAMFDPNATLPQWWHKTNLPLANVLICTDAYSAGHNLQCANTLVHFELPWNPTTLRQREGRIIRKGQTFDRVSIVQMHHIPNNPNLHAYRQHLESRLHSRDTLQMNWFSKPPIHPNEILVIRADGIPTLWARHGHTWIPIHPDDLDDIPNTAQIQQITLAEAFSDAIRSIQSTYQCLWDYLKFAQNTPKVSQAIKSLTQATYQCAFFPQLVHHNCSHFELLYENLPQVMQHISHLPINSIPSPNTPCWKVVICPQITHTFQQVIHKLSTDVVPILSP